MYLKRNKNNEAIEYLQQKCVQIDNIDPLITSNATTIDLVVNTKKQIALQKNIKTSISIQLSKQPNMDEFDLCCLLGNALDNAIEHIGGERIINLRILGNNITTKIVISNSVDRSILKYNPLLKTSKLDKYHGFGILSMRETVKKYHGIIQFSERKGYFICTITLFN